MAAPRPQSPPPPPPPSPPGTPCWLQARECSGAASGQRALHGASFSHFQLQQEVDLFRLTGHHAVWPPVYLRRRSPVREVLAAEGLLLALAESGVCTAYDQGAAGRHGVARGTATLPHVPLPLPPPAFVWRCCLHSPFTHRRRHHAESGAPLCYLNVQADELICSLFVCPLSRSLLTVSTFTGGEMRGCAELATVWRTHRLLHSPPPSQTTS